MKHKPPGDYPTCCHKDSLDPLPSRHLHHTTTLVPVLQTFKFLIKASNFRAFNFFYKKLNVTNVTAYMQSVGISSNFYKLHMIDKCRSHWNKNISHIDTDRILDIPTMCSVDIDLCQFIDTFMHLVFQGIVKHVVQFTKKNINLVWIKKITLCSTQDQITSSKYTHVLAIGRKGVPHCKVNPIHNMELIDLSFCGYRYFGCKSVQRNVLVVVETLAVLADRPEMNFILSHNGLSKTLWGYAGYMDCKKIPSCNKYFKQQ